MTPLLDVRIVHLMTVNPASIEPESTLGEAAGRMLEGGFRHLPVVDVDQRLVGMLSERDLRARLGVELERFPEAANGLLEEQVERAMRPDPTALGEDARLGDILDVLASERIGAVPVVDAAERLVGIVSYLDVVGFLREQGSSFLLVPAETRPAKAATAKAPAKGAATKSAPAKGAPSSTKAPSTKRPARARRARGGAAKR